MPSCPPIAPALALVSVLAGCAEPEAPLADLEYCGSSEPVRILELQPGQACAGSHSVGGRVLYAIGRLDLATWPPPTVPDFSWWSSGPCGESPVQFTDALPHLFTLERWPEVPLACIDDSGVVAIDPSDAAPPRVLFALDRCADIIGWSDHGLVLADTYGGYDRPPIDLKLIPYPDDPDTAAPAARTLAAGIHDYGLQLSPDALHYITDDAALVRIDLPGGEATTVRSNIGTFRFSPDLRYLAWQDAGSFANNLRDNTTGATFDIGMSESLLSDLDFSRIDDGVLGVGERLFLAPAFTVVDLPPKNRVLTVAPDHSFAVISAPLGGDPWLRRMDLSDGTFTTLHQDPGRILAIDENDLVVLGLPPCCKDDDWRKQAPVWRIPIDGGPALLLAERASPTRVFIDANSLITVVDIDPRGRGTLIRIDTDTRAEQVLDDHVLAYGVTRIEPSVLRYNVDHGARSGLYTLRLATTP